MLKKIIFGLLWIALVVYAFGFAPPAQPDILELITNLSILCLLFPTVLRDDLARRGIDRNLVLRR